MDLHLELQSDGKEIIVLERRTVREVEPMIRTSPANHASPSIEMVERSTVSTGRPGVCPFTFAESSLLQTCTYYLYLIYKWE